MNEKISVLIADDNSEFTETLEEFLNNVKKLRSLELPKMERKLIEEIKRKNQICLLDMIMPQIDGLGVLEKLQLIKLKETNVYNDFSCWTRKITPKALSLGADYYTSKTFRYSDSC